MALHTASTPVISEPAPATAPSTPSPKAAMAWLAGGALVTFAVSWLSTTVLELHHDVFYLVYLTFALGYLIQFARAGAPWREVLTRNVWWSLTIGVLVGIAVARQIMSLSGTSHPWGRVLQLRARLARPRVRRRGRARARRVPSGGRLRRAAR